ncbi:hypothetical protein BBH88_04495 [Planococcus antarcticus DSM 14505]|uniref:Prevent-host-death protein n=1 Tax=Planococcus antarcticus DSM 14505 TaxID=1185653 RepID=A0ABM6D383_9BACL|nr:hypothetical protein [Planococcus antarcticus]ANU09607.1 hypothetical protein BBH88_04495 [Planococcus antarcticus DSM 14505]
MKTPSNKELLSGDRFQSLSLQNLLSLVENNEKVGIVINDQVSIAMLKWDKYEELLNSLVTQENRISEIESQFEDLILAVNDSAAIQAVENGHSKEYAVDNLTEVFDMLQQQSKKNDSTESNS